MDTDFTDLIRQARQAVDALQAEIDAAIDRHGMLRRAIDLLEGADVPLPLVVVGYDLDVPIEEAKLGLLTATPKVGIGPAKTKRKPVNGSVDYEAVAAWINEAKAKGTYSQLALADMFGRPVSAVKNWPGTCKQRGLLDKPAAASATVVAATVLPNSTPVVAVERPTMVSGTGNKPMTAKRPHVLACTEDDCGAEFATTEASKLFRHCREAHNRFPYGHEKAPVLEAATAVAS